MKMISSLSGGPFARLLICLGLCLSFIACGGGGYEVQRIIDGHSLQLSNGAVVELLNVSNSPENSLILERYCKGKILLFDKDNSEITHIASERIAALVYNSNGDCINDLLEKVKAISRDTPIVTTPGNQPGSPASVVGPASGGASGSGSGGSSGPAGATNPGAPANTIVHMRLKDGIYYIPASVNGVEMDFIFDTGASLVSLSSKEADALFESGKIGIKNMVGKGQFIDATGGISEGSIINLDSVTIGDRVLQNVQACIVQKQDAPLLLGQSALEKFGKISIDYNKLEIAFE